MMILPMVMPSAITSELSSICQTGALPPGAPVISASR
jgi:hypothetical protein